MKKYREFINEDSIFRIPVYIEKDGFESGPIYIESIDMTLKIKVFYSNVTIVKLIKDESDYMDLSIKVEKSKYLPKGDFFLNPEVNKKIVNDLKSQGFIQPTSIKDKYGEQEIESYSITIS